MIDTTLNRIGLGYMEPIKKSPYDPVRWVEEEHQYTHQFSLQRRFYDYGYYRLKEILSLSEYLNMEAYLLDTALKYLRLGADTRNNDEARIRRRDKEVLPGDVEKEIKDILK